MSFTGKRIIVTGASTGIGEGLAVALASRGAHLVLAARNESELDRVCARCVSAGGHAFSHRTDVTDLASCAALVSETVARLGGIDAVVHNAGISMWARFEEVEDLSIFERIMAVNYLGAVYLTHHALPHLKRSRGLLVAISSLTGKTGVPTRTGYAASKHAMQGFFDSLRIELRSSGVDVLVVSPGFVATDIRSRAFGPDGKPLAESPREESRGTMPIEECVALIVRAMEGRKREVVMTARARLGLWMKLVAPGLVDRIAAAAVKEQKRR